MCREMQPSGNMALWTQTEIQRRTQESIVLITRTTLPVRAIQSREIYYWVSRCSTAWKAAFLIPLATWHADSWLQCRVQKWWVLIPAASRLAFLLYQHFFVWQIQVIQAERSFILISH